MTKKNGAGEKFPAIPSKLCASPYGDFHIPVRFDEDTATLGHFHTGKQEIVIKPGQPVPEQWVILFHELLHFVEDQMKNAGIIKRRADHAFIATGANLIFGTLAMSGLIAGLDAKEAKKAVKRWVETDVLANPEEE